MRSTRKFQVGEWAVLMTDVMKPGGKRSRGYDYSSHVLFPALRTYVEIVAYKPEKLQYCYQVRLPNKETRWMRSCDIEGEWVIKDLNLRTLYPPPFELQAAV